VIRRASGNVLIAFYGDDFTGSTDALEVASLAGLRTILFTRLPDEKTLSSFRDYDVIGVAGTARFRNPKWMDENLPAVFETLASLQPRVVHYKVCSTYDSSPTVGSIGRATDIGTRVVGGSWSPAIIGAPQLGRYQAFSNLFAVADGVRYRIDRHPTMSRHPVTPMNEGDLRLHLAAQTKRPVHGIDLVDIRTLDAVETRGPDCPVVFLDVCDEITQKCAGKLVWEDADPILFSASSSGLEYALVAYWRSIGMLPEQRPEMAPPSSIDRLLVLSGSCSAATAKQIAYAEANGFKSIRMDVAAASDPELAPSELKRILSEVSKAFEVAKGVIVFAAKTVDDPAYQLLKDVSERRGVDFTTAQQSLGRFLGEVARSTIPALSLRRVVVAGGDTSGAILEALPIHALEVDSPLDRGAPLCRCFSNEETFDGLQMSLKGGQMGKEEFFVSALG